MNSFTWYLGAFVGAYAVLITEAMGGQVNWWTPLLWAVVWFVFEAVAWFVGRVYRSFKAERDRLRGLS